MSRAHSPAISALRTSPFTRYYVAPLTLLALFSGCYWSATRHDPASVIREDEPSKVRLATFS